MTQTTLDIVPARPPMAAPREVVLASAGAGKTFHVSSRIIALLAHGEEPESILASTFTRKAAGEILRRVLHRMAEAALSPVSAGDLARHTTLDRSRPVPADPGFWADQLERVVRVLHRMSVSTLDSYFVGAARAFVHELGLPAGWTIADEPAVRRLRSEGLQRVLDRADAGEMVELLRMVNRGEVRRSVHDHLLDQLDTLLAIEAQLDPEAHDPWSAFDEVDPGGPPPTPEERETLARRFEAVEVPLTGRGKPRKHWMSNLENAAAAVRASDWEGFLALTLCRRALEDDPVFDSVGVPAGVCALVYQGGEFARRTLRPALGRRMKALGRLTRDFGAAYRELQAREGAYRFDDLTRRLGELDPFGEGAALYYRLDARTRHVLLDEFQDTSLAQWEALAPLVDEVLQDEARSGVIVADPKQSIYGWRGGEPELVHGVRDRYGLNGASLSKSWRSSPVVLDLVNRVFEGIDVNPVIEAAAECAEAARRWQKDFAPHVAAHENLSGYARVEAAPRDGGRGSVRPLLCRYAAARIRELREAAPGTTIGVLTRTNPTVARLMLELRMLGVPVSGEGGTPLTDSAPCEAILALIRLVDHPADRIARYHVARSPLGPVVEIVDPDDDQAVARTGRRLRAELMEHGYGPTLDGIADEIAGHCDPRELRRLAQLVEFAHRYDDHATLRPADFVRLVETERMEDPNAARVRVMTVHQAKGLEFDLVVLPDLDSTLFRENGLPAALPRRPEPTSPATEVHPRIGKALRPLFPEVAEAHAQASAAAVRDGLSTFYVALTRAARAVHVILSEDGPGGQGSALTPARILRAAVAPGEPAVAGRVLYEAGDAKWFTAGGDAAPPDEGDGARSATTTGVRLRTDTPRRRILPRRSPSQMEGGARVRIADVLRLDSGAALDRGSVVHAWFEALEWIEDDLPADDELRRLALRHAPDMPREAVEKTIVDFRGWCAAPAVGEVLARARFPAGATVEREVPFIGREGEILMEGIIDRLVLIREDSRVVGAEIVDFKTDRVQDDPGLLARRTAHYVPQIEAYRRAVARTYRLDESRIAAKLLFVEAGTVEEV